MSQKRGRVWDVSHVGHDSPSKSYARARDNVNREDASNASVPPRGSWAFDGCEPDRLTAAPRDRGRTAATHFALEIARAWTGVRAAP